MSASAGERGEPTRFGRLLNRVDVVLLGIGVATAFGVMILSSLDAISRYVFDRPIKGTFEITEDYLLPILVFLPLGYSYGSGAQIRVDVLYRFIPRGVVRRMIDLATGAIGIGYVLVLAAGAWYQTAESLRLGARSTSLLAYPLAPAFFLVVIGTVWLAVRMAYAIVTDDQPEPPRDDDGTSDAPATEGTP